MHATLKSIGVVRSPYKNRSEAPSQGTKEISEIQVFKEYSEGLKDIETFTHLHVLYWLHQAENHTLLVHTPWDIKPHGVFATRSPNRPNPLAYSIVKLLKRDGNILTVQSLDAIDGTPILDIKPYSPLIDSRPKANNGWLKGKYHGGTK